MFRLCRDQSLHGAAHGLRVRSEIPSIANNCKSTFLQLADIPEVAGSAFFVELKQKQILWLSFNHRAFVAFSQNPDIAMPVLRFVIYKEVLVDPFRLN